MQDYFRARSTMQVPSTEYNFRPHLLHHNTSFIAFSMNELKSSKLFKSISCCKEISSDSTPNNFQNLCANEYALCCKYVLINSNFDLSFIIFPMTTVTRCLHVSSVADHSCWANSLPIALYLSAKETY